MVFKYVSFACALAIARVVADMLGWWNRYRVGASKSKEAYGLKVVLARIIVCLACVSLVTWWVCAIFFPCLLRLLSNVVKWLWAREEPSVSLYEALCRLSLD